MRDVTETIFTLSLWAPESRVQCRVEAALSPPVMCNVQLGRCEWVWGENMQLKQTYGCAEQLKLLGIIERSCGWLLWCCCDCVSVLGDMWYLELRLWCWAHLTHFTHCRPRTQWKVEAMSVGVRQLPFRLHCSVKNRIAWGMWWMLYAEYVIHVRHVCGELPDWL